MRSNHPSVRIESSETMMGAGIAEDRVSSESVTESSDKTRLCGTPSDRASDDRPARSTIGRFVRESLVSLAPLRAPRLVRKSEARSSLAEDPRSLRHLGERSDAAANAGQDRARLLRAVDAALSHARGARRGGRRRRPARLARPWLLFACPALA